MCKIVISQENALIISTHTNTFLKPSIAKHKYFTLRGCVRHPVLVFGGIVVSVFLDRKFKFCDVTGGTVYRGDDARRATTETWGEV